MEGFLGIGGNELIIILIFAFLIFGPDKLPDIARTIGRAIAKFRDAQNEVNEVIRQEVYDPLNDAAKDQPEWVRGLCAQWLSDVPDNAAARRICQRAAAAGNSPADAAPAEVKPETAPAAEPTSDDLDAMLGVSKPAPSAVPAEGGEA